MHFTQSAHLETVTLQSSLSADGTDRGIANANIGTLAGDASQFGTVQGFYKVEVIHRRGPSGPFEVVEFATLEWVV